jgi:hypothetical protein
MNNYDHYLEAWLGKHYEGKVRFPMMGTAYDLYMAAYKGQAIAADTTEQRAAVAQGCVDGMHDKAPLSQEAFITRMREMREEEDK